MLSDEAWNRIRHYTNEVVNREMDYITFEEGVVERRPEGAVTVTLCFSSRYPDRLEPEDY